MTARRVCSLLALAGGLGMVAVISGCGSNSGPAPQTSGGMSSHAPPYARSGSGGQNNSPGAPPGAPGSSGGSSAPAAGGGQ